MLPVALPLRIRRRRSGPTTRRRRHSPSEGRASRNARSERTAEPTCPRPSAEEPSSAPCSRTGARHGETQRSWPRPVGPGRGRTRLERPGNGDAKESRCRGVQKPRPGDRSDPGGLPNRLAKHAPTDATQPRETPKIFRRGGGKPTGSRTLEPSRSAMFVRHGPRALERSVTALVIDRRPQYPAPAQTSRRAAPREQLARTSVPRLPWSPPRAAR